MQGSGDIGLGDIHVAVKILLSRWLFIGAAAILGCALATLLAFGLTPKYRAEVLLEPVAEDPAAGAVAGLAGQFSGVASLAGISLGGKDNRKIEAIATLQSRSLTEQFVANENVLPVLFPSKWDSQKAQWKSSSGKVPTLWDANKLFAKKIRTVTEDKRTGLVSLAIEWDDPRLAAKWANELVVSTNRRLQARAIEQSEQNIKYLDEQLERTTTLEVRQAIYRLVESEIKTIMLARSSDNYAFKVIDPAVVPQEKSSPKRALIVAFGTLGFLFAACGIAYLRGPRQSAGI